MGGQRLGGDGVAVAVSDELVGPHRELVPLLLGLPPEGLLLVEQGDVLVVGGGNDLGLVGLGHHVLSTVSSVQFPSVDSVSDILEKRLESRGYLVLSMRQTASHPAMSLMRLSNMSASHPAMSLPILSLMRLSIMRQTTSDPAVSLMRLSIMTTSDPAVSLV